MERDFYKFLLILTSFCISTHTLTWSVTSDKDGKPRIKNFNSHAHVERDLLSLMKLSDLSNFNSHAHVERDQWVLLAWQNFSISTHTLTWSVTKDFLRYAIGKIISTHTLTWSVTYNGCGNGYSI